MRAMGRMTDEDFFAMIEDAAAVARMLGLLED